jgi:hypothetical protein
MLTPGVFLLLSAAGLLTVCTAVVYAARYTAGRLRRRSLRARRRVPPEGMVRHVSGRVIGIRPVRSPVETMPCVVAWTVVRGLGPDGRSATIRVVTACDFLVESPEGVFVVRAEGLRVDAGSRDVFDYLTLVPAGPLGETVLETGIDLEAPIEYREVRIDHGDEIAVRGVWRREAATHQLEVSGYRLAPVLPTLSLATAFL